MAPKTVGLSTGDVGGMAGGESEGEGDVRPRTTTTIVETFP